MTIAITNYGREVAGTLTRRADSSSGWMQGGWSSASSTSWAGSPDAPLGTARCRRPSRGGGRASASDVHAVVIEEG